MVYVYGALRSVESFYNELIYKMIECGFTKFLIHFIANYVGNRKCFVSVKNTKSDTKCILEGVPQGSVLAPTLFNIYINGINNLKM